MNPRETMSKRMGRLKTLRMGGGLGAGPLLLGRFFLREGPGGEGSSALLERGSPARPEGRSGSPPQPTALLAQAEEPPTHSRTLFRLRLLSLGRWR